MNGNVSGTIMRDSSVKSVKKDIFLYLDDAIKLYQDANSKLLQNV